MAIKPVDGMVALRFVDDDDGDDDAMPSSSGAESYEGCLAIVVAVGAKVSGIKKGQTVITRPYARDGLRVGGITFVESYCIVGTIAD